MTVRSLRTLEMKHVQLLLTSEDLTAADFSWIDRAIKTAQRSKHRVRVGAVLICGSHISCDYNRIRNSPDISYMHATTHAEMGAIRRSPKTKGGTVYVARLGAQGRLLPSFPCNRCFPQLLEAGIRRIVWWNGERWMRGKI